MSDGDLIVGAEYDVEHKTEGQFRLLVTENDGPWVYGIIRDGLAACGAPGQAKVVRRSFCTFDLVAGSQRLASQGDESCQSP